MVKIYNLDGKRLTEFRDLDERTFNITEEIEKRLGLPAENQVIYAGGKKLTAFKKLPVRLNLSVGFGYQPATNSEEAYRLYSKFNGSFVNTRIWSKYRGHELLEEFNSKPFSTYLDLNLYIESKLNIPVDLQVILRKDFIKPRYWKPENNECLINYIFNGDRLPRENIVYLMVKDSPRYVSHKNDIFKLKPISIYSQNGPGETTKLMTFLPEEHIFNISQIKSKLEKQLGLPNASLIIYRVTDQNEIKPFSMNYDGDMLHSVIHCFDLIHNEVVLYLTCDSNGDEKASQTCTKYGIKILEVEIKTQSGKIIAKCKPTPRSKTFGSLKSIVEKTHNLSIKKQLLYGTRFNILDDRESIWGHFGWRMVNTTSTIYLLMKKTESKAQDEICEQFDIPQTSPDIVVKSLDGRKELLKTNIDMLENTSEKWFNCLIQDVREKLQPPSEFVLSFYGEILHEYHALACRDWKYLYFREGIVQEEITINLTFKPSLNARVEEFCENHDISTLKTLKVKFLTSEMDVDIRKEPMKNRKNCLENILEVKRYLSEKKKIPARAIDIFFNGRMLNDRENLLVLFVEEYSSPTSLEFHVVIKTTNVKVNLKSPCAARLTLPVDYITLPGSKTFYNVKEEIASLTGIPISQLRITCSKKPSISNKCFIQDFVYNLASKEIELIILKTVTLRVVDKYGNTLRHSYDDITYDDETVNLLLSRLNIDKRFKLQKNKCISGNTLLHDLGCADIIELKEETKDDKSSCYLM